jgi:hypothetical protein
MYHYLPNCIIGGLQVERPRPVGAHFLLDLSIFVFGKSPSPEERCFILIAKKMFFMLFVYQLHFDVELFYCCSMQVVLRSLGSETIVEGDLYL